MRKLFVRNRSLLLSLVAIVSAVFEVELPLPVFSYEFLLLVEMVELFIVPFVFLSFRFLLFLKYDLLKYDLLELSLVSISNFFQFSFSRFRFLSSLTCFTDAEGGRGETGGWWTTCWRRIGW